MLFGIISGWGGIFHLVQTLLMMTTSTKLIIRIIIIIIIIMMEWVSESKVSIIIFRPDPTLAKLVLELPHLSLSPPQYISITILTIIINHPY